jgi:hypothetical protein
MKLKREQAMIADRNAVSLALKLIKASGKGLMASAEKQKEIEKKSNEEVMKNW